MVLGTPSGLHALSEAAATALHLPVPPSARGGPPLLPAAEDPAGGSQQYASEIACGASDKSVTDTPPLQEPRGPEQPGHALTTPRASVAVPGSVSLDIPPDLSWQSSERYLAALLDKYDSLAGPELATLDTLLNRHLASTRPPDISVAFKNGVNRTYVWVRNGRGTAVGDRHLRRRAAALTGLQAQITGNRASTYASAHARILRQAQASRGLSVVPVCGAGSLPPRLQALLAARCNISGAQWSQLREAFGGRHSCFSSRETLRGAAAAVAYEPGRQVRTDERGAHLVDFHSALESVAEGLWSSNQWVDRFVRDGTGAKIAHTTAFVPTALGEPYTLHADSTPDLHLCVGLDKGGRGTPTAKLVATVANQACPQSRPTSILMSTMPCIADDNAALHEMIGPWVVDLEQTLKRGVVVGSTRRAVRLIWTGDLSFLSALVGHAGATARFPCVYCPAVIRPGPLHAELIAKYGTLQRPGAPPTGLRTRQQFLDAMMSYRTCDNDSLTLPLSRWQHLSIVKCPLLAVDPAEVSVIPLHTTLGGTLTLIDLGLEAAYEAGGADACLEAAEALGRALLEDVRVSPAPYHGGALEGRECHRLTAKYPLVCAALAPYLPTGKLAALRTGWTDWAAIVGTLNSAADIPLTEIESFARLARGLVPPLQVAFPWLSVTPKLHALAHHAPAFLRRFGSLGAYGEQALEAWHGFFNYSQARCTADSFLGACKRLVEQAALQRQPGATSELANGQRRMPSQKAGARLATRPNDGRLRRNKDVQRGTVAGDSRADEEMCQWAKKRACKAKRHVDAFNARHEVEYGSDDEYSDSELVGGDEGIDPVAALVIA